MQGKPNPKIKHLVKFEFHSSQYRITMEGSAQPDGSGGGWGGRKGPDHKHITHTFGHLIIREFLIYSRFSWDQQSKGNDST